MALINNLYVQAIKEDWDKSVNSTSHPVEKGIETTDSVRKQPITLSLSGNIVDVGNTKAQTICDKLHELENAGSLIKFVGRKTASNLQIQSFNESYSNEIWGGFSFSMELKEVRIAEVAYVATSTNTAKTTSTGKIKVGDIVVFKGGNVYVSSDAKKAATTKGRQTCKVTKINERSWSLHDYHLISTEKKYPYNVYGWCDIEDIEGGTSDGTAKIASNSTEKTKVTTNSGTQQVKGRVTENVYTEEVYHTVKKGDTLKSVCEKYKSLRNGTNSVAGYVTMEWIGKHAKNKQAVVVSWANIPSKTSYVLITGKKLFVGYQIKKKPKTVNLSQYVKSKSFIENTELKAGK